MKKIVIIGAGPAGASLGIYLKRFNQNPLIFHNFNSSLMLAHKIDNYYGLLGITGTDLYVKGVDHYKSLGGEIIDEEVISIDSDLTVHTSNNSYKADLIVLASGNKFDKPKIKNLYKFETKGISYCATCDGFFYRNKTIGLYGNGQFAYHEYEYLKNITSDIKVFVDANKPIDDEILKLNPIKINIKEVIGEDRLSAVILEDGTTINLDGLFIANGSASVTNFSNQLGILLNQNNQIVVDENFETNIKNVFAIGDCTPGIKQVSRAVDEGMKLSNILLARIKQDDK